MKARYFVLGLLLLLLGTRSWGAAAGGTWTTLTNLPAGGFFGHMHILSDGTVMSEDGSFQFTTGPRWFRLTPGPSGGYTNGVWTTNASMNFTHEDFASQVLQNGKLMVAGGEYGTGGGISELYDPVSNKWTVVDVPLGLLNTNAPANGFSDASSMLLPDGRMMVSPVSPATNNATLIYDPSTNSPATNKWTAGPPTLQSQSEGSWVKLADDSILTIDFASTSSERYIPSLNKWVKDANLPVALYDTFGTELGPGMLLPNAKAIFFGATGRTAIYTPSPLGGTNMGTWAAAATIPNNQGMPDAPAAMMPNGNILCAVAPVPVSGTVFGNPVSFYEYDYISNKFTQVSSPTGGTTFSGPCWPTLMLCLADGSVLFSSRTQNLYIYHPTNGVPLVAAMPVIHSIKQNPDGSLRLTGTLFNGICEGAAYGDDEQEASNFPLVRFTDGNGVVRYGRSYNWSSTGVATGTNVLSTECNMPAGASLTDSIQVVANGVASDPVRYYDTWVDFNDSVGPFAGTFANPYNMLAAAVQNVAPGGVIKIKASSTTERLRITKATRIVSIGGTSHIGN